MGMAFKPIIRCGCPWCSFQKQTGISPVHFWRPVICLPLRTLAPVPPQSSITTSVLLTPTLPSQSSRGSEFDPQKRRIFLPRSLPQTNDHSITERKNLQEKHVFHGAYHAEQELKLRACHPVASHHNSFDLIHQTSLEHGSREYDQLPCWKIRSVRSP